MSTNATTLHKKRPTSSQPKRFGTGERATVVALLCSPLLAAGYAYWNMSARNEQSSPEPSKSAIATQAAVASSVATTSASQSLDELVRWKYRYLLTDLDSNVFAQEQVKQLLLEYEQAAALTETAERRGEDAAMLTELKAWLAEIDDVLRQSLDWAHYEQYENLKHSETEQRQLAKWFEGISNDAALDAYSERAILEAKLRHKNAYEAVLMNAGLHRKTLSAEARQLALAAVANALKDYRDNFLIEARALLNDEQYTLLRKHETTEFQRMLAELQTTTNSK